MTLTQTEARLPVDRTARRGAAVALVAAGLLGVVSALTQPDLGSSPTQRLAALDSTRATVSTVTLVLLQPFLLAGLLALASTLRDRAPRLTATGLVLAFVGAFGEAVTGGMTASQLLMARDEAHRATYATLLHDANASPLMVFALLGLAGSVISLLLLSIAVFRTRFGPRWVAPALWVFLVGEYAGAAVSPVFGYVAVVAALAAFLALARELVRH